MQERGGQILASSHKYLQYLQQSLSELAFSFPIVAEGHMHCRAGLVGDMRAPW